jgi:hypothetical protein
MRSTRRPPISPAAVGLREVLYEFRRVGRYLRVVAIDPVTGTEVIMMGDPKAGTTELKRLAMRKLAYVIDKRRREAAGGAGGVDRLA